MKALLTLALFATVLFGEPVPSGEIILEEIPGGIARTGKTDRLGVVVFERVKPGNYAVKLALKPVAPRGQQARIGENAQSVTHKVTQSVGPGGTALVAVSFELVTARTKTPDPPVTVTVGPQGGKVTVTVTKASSPPK